MNNVDVDNVRCGKDKHGNLLPFSILVEVAADENSTIDFEFEPEDPEESYWW